MGGESGTTSSVSGTVGTSSDLAGTVVTTSAVIGMVLGIFPVSGVVSSVSGVSGSVIGPDETCWPASIGLVPATPSATLIAASPPLALIGTEGIILVEGTCL